MSGFTRSCAANSAAGWKVAGRTLKHFEGKHPILNGGCLIFAPFITLFVWTIQLLILLTIAAVPAAWGAAWGVLAGVGAVIDACRRKSHRPIAHPSAVLPPPAPPPPPA